MVNRVSFVIVHINFSGCMCKLFCSFSLCPGSQNNTEETGSKSANAVDSNLTSSSKLHQKAAKSAQQSKAAKHQECVVCKKVLLLFHP